MGGRGASAGDTSAVAATIEEPKKKRKFSEFIKDARERELDRFFGERKKLSNKYFTFEHVKSNDEIIVITKNIHTVKENLVMIVNDNQAVYLKDWNVKPVRNFDKGFEAYAVKLQRKYFKPYTFRSNFEGYSFKTPDTFDSLMKVAKSQNGTKIATGHFRGD